MNPVEETAKLLSLDELQRLFEAREHILGGIFTRPYQAKMAQIIESRLEQVNLAKLLFFFFDFDFYLLNIIRNYIRIERLIHDTAMIVLIPKLSYYDT